MIPFISYHSLLFRIEFLAPIEKQIDMLCDEKPTLSCGEDASSSLSQLHIIKNYTEYKHAPSNDRQTLAVISFGLFYEKPRRN